MGYQRKQEDKRRLAKLYSDVFSHRRWICSGVCHHWADERLHRVYRGRRSREFKQICNRKLRRMDEIPNYGGYKKCSEFWWSIW